MHLKSRQKFQLMFSIVIRALSWAITSFGNKFCLKKRLRLIKASDNRFYVKFMQLEIGLLSMTRHVPETLPKEFHKLVAITPNITWTFKVINFLHSTEQLQLVRRNDQMNKSGHNSKTNHPNLILQKRFWSLRT